MPWIRWVDLIENKNKIHKNFLNNMVGHQTSEKYVTQWFWDSSTSLRFAMAQNPDSIWPPRWLSCPRWSHRIRARCAGTWQLKVKKGMSFKCTQAVKETSWSIWMKLKLQIGYDMVWYGYFEWYFSCVNVKPSKRIQTEVLSTSFQRSSWSKVKLPMPQLSCLAKASNVANRFWGTKLIWRHFKK